MIFIYEPLTVTIRVVTERTRILVLSEQILDFDDAVSLAYVLGAFTHGQNTTYTLYDDRGALSDVPTRQQQLDTLDYLAYKNAINYTVTDHSRVHRDSENRVSFITTPCEISIVNADILSNLRLLTAEVVELLESKKPAVLEYSLETGIGLNNGKPFNLLNKTEKPFFDLLVQNIGKPTHKKNLADEVSISMDSHKSATIDINTYVSSIRRFTGLSRYQLIQKGDFITLNATIL